MGDLATDTVVTPAGDDVFAAELSPDWEIWGPNGGYLASVALRAAGLATGRARPASINAHFVGAGRSGPVDITVETNRATKVATSVTIRLTQEGRPWLVASVWGVDDDLDGLEHHTSDRPLDVPAPDSLPDARALAGDRGAMPHPFWRNLDIRPLTWIDDWENRAQAEPSQSAWYRFVPSEMFDDPWIDACRSLILIDLDSWPAANRAHVGELQHYAPTIEVAARFVGDTSRDPWLLSRADAPVAAGGLIAASGLIWNMDRELVAIGGSTLLCRPAARRTDR